MFHYYFASYCVGIAWMSLKGRQSTLWVRNYAKKAIRLKYFYFMTDVSSVTRWLHYVFDIWPFTTMKIGPNKLKFEVMLISVFQKSFSTWCQSGEILPNLVALDVSNRCVRFSTCACGKWICTSHACTSPNATPVTFTSTEEYVNYDDMDNQID